MLAYHAAIVPEHDRSLLPLDARLDVDVGHDDVIEMPQDGVTLYFRDSLHCNT